MHFHFHTRMAMKWISKVFITEFNYSWYSCSLYCQLSISRDLVTVYSGLEFIEFNSLNIFKNFYVTFFQVLKLDTSFCKHKIRFIV